MKKYLKCSLLGLAAGAAISLGGFLFIVAKTYFAAAGQPVGALFFTIGLLCVCFLGFNLYTGKIGFLFNQDKKKPYIIDLAIMLVFNLVASCLIGLIFHYAFLNNKEIMTTVDAIMSKKVFEPSSNNYLWLLGSSILCGMLVYVAVFIFKNTKATWLKIVGIIVPIWLFVFMGFDHCIANGFYFGLGLVFGNYLMWLNLLLCIAGNSLGAIGLNWVVSLIKKDA